MMKGKKPHVVYISGPITGVPDFQNNFNTAATALLSRPEVGAVINPAGLVGGIIEGEGITNELIMKIDMMLLEHATAICMLPGWERSRGARDEHRRAKELRLVEMEARDV